MELKSESDLPKALNGDEWSSEFRSVQWVSHLGISLSRRPSAVNLGAHSSSQNLLESDCVLSSCHVQLFATLWTVARQAPLSMGFSRQEHRSGLPCPPPGDHPNPRIELGSPTLQVDSLLSEPPGGKEDNLSDEKKKF